GRDRGTRDHHRHEARHEHAHEDLADVLHEGEQGADLDVTRIHLDAAEPDHTHHGHVEHEHRQREQQHEERADPPADLHDVGVREPEPQLFDALAHEGAHDAHAGELFAHDAVHVVEAILVGAEEGHHLPDNDAGQQQDRGD